MDLPSEGIEGILKATRKTAQNGPKRLNRLGTVAVLPMVGYRLISIKLLICRNTVIKWCISNDAVEHTFVLITKLDIMKAYSKSNITVNRIEKTGGMFRLVVVNTDRYKYDLVSYG